jgi:hypothetical protein
MMARLIAAAVGVMLLAYVAAVVFSALAVGLAAYGLFRLIRYAWRAYVAARDARRHERAELLARAEIQHRWSLAGDPRGTYGRYPPASIT